MHVNAGENSGLDERARRRLAREGLPMEPSMEQESSPSESPEPPARKLGAPALLQPSA